MLESQEDLLSGYVLLIRVAGLSEFTQRLGGRKTDALLKRMADDLAGYCHTHPGWMTTCLRDAEFILICPGLASDEACSLGDELCGLWSVYPGLGLSDQAGLGHIGMTAFQSGDSLAEVRMRASRALTQAQALPLNSWQMDNDVDDGLGQLSDHDWRQLIELSCREDLLQLHWYPVCNPEGGILWYEGMLYRPKTATTPQVSALRLVSQALRLGLVHLLDINALSLALNHGPGGVLAVNMSSISLAHADFLPQVMLLLQQNPQRQVNFEFNESGLEDHWDAFLAFSRAVRREGHQLAVEIQGHNMALVARTREADISYLVLDNSLTQGIHDDKGRSALLRGLLKMASLMSVHLEAKGINTRQDVQALIDIGLHCLTGPVVTYSPDE